MNKVNINEKMAQIAEYWSPRITGELNGQHVKLARLKGEFTWHHHAVSYTHLTLPTSDLV